MTSSSGQGAAPSGGCPRGTPASENRDGTGAAVTGSGAGSHAVRSVCGRQREEDRARGRQIRGASGGEGRGARCPNCAAVLTERRRRYGYALLFFLHSASTFLFFHLTQHSQGPVLPVWVLNQGSSLSERLSCALKPSHQNP